jgi:hypothetical protein
MFFSASAKIHDDACSICILLEAVDYCEYQWHAELSTASVSGGDQSHSARPSGLHANSIYGVPMTGPGRAILRFKLPTGCEQDVEMLG